MHQAGLAEVHLAVDHAGQDVEPGAVDHPPRIAARADFHDPAVAHPDIGANGAAGGVDGAAGEKQIEGHGKRAFRIGSRLPTLRP